MCEVGRAATGPAATGPGGTGQTAITVGTIIGRRR